MTGDEPKEYFDNAENLSVVSLGAVLNRDDSFRDLLDAQIGSRFWRNPQGAFGPMNA